LQGSSDLINWTPLSTNVPAAAPFTLIDPAAATAAHRFYRTVTP